MEYFRIKQHQAVEPPRLHYRAVQLCTESRSQLTEGACAEGVGAGSDDGSGAGSGSTGRGDGGGGSSESWHRAGVAIRAIRATANRKANTCIMNKFYIHQFNFNHIVPNKVKSYHHEIDDLRNAQDLFPTHAKIVCL